MPKAVMVSLCQFSVCLSVCLTVIKITQKVVELFSRILVGRWGHGSDMNPLDFGTGPDHGLDTG